MRRDASHATPNGGEVSETDATKRRSVVASTHVSDEAAGTISLLCCKSMASVLGCTEYRWTCVPALPSGCSGVEYDKATC